MRPDLETLLEEFERLTLDERIFLSLVNDEDIEVHIQFRRAEGRHWSIWFPINPPASKQTVSRGHFPSVLRAFGISVEIFAAEIESVLLTQAAWADQFVREVGELLGAEPVRMAIRNNLDFAESLKEVFRGLEKEEQKSVQESKREAPAEVRAPESILAGAAKTRLRIVRSP